ncbi:hypothetical protein ARMSODRAFT_1017314 [Armillaria solidipes]|uniref:Uncharacterized protein n=1 Tax=Armillaria solidipes TaxID=1076256 RepID=A0A2H3BKL7_9AGAR|nr:hypothetical protein ARMSODRAFT_1017314 [Armillaria solidipes]
MALSKETSVEGALPLILATLIRIIAKFLCQAVQMEVRDDLESASDSSSEVGVEGDDNDDDPFIDTPQNADESVPCSEGDKEPEESQLALKGNLADAIKDAVRRLKDSSLDCLIGSYSTIPHHNMRNIIPTITRHSETLRMELKTKREAELLAALHISEQTNQIYQQRMIELQATNILNKAYCKALHEQLAFQEAKKSRKGKGRLMGDGLPVLLTSDFFYEQMGKEERKKALTVWKEKVAKRQKIMDAWQAEWEREKQEYVAAKLKWASDKKKDKVKG